MKYRITSYQAVYVSGCRDRVKLKEPIYTNDIETERAKIKGRVSSIGMKCIGVNLEYEELK